ncbi:hypothetical protein EV200_108202 [Pedobacter psychrotolerans]|uniref:Uncharacterized protein n=1 Tax=Pedobacter psychrotolerans TaxID=1843235 RepID=A0A4R2H4Z1_9SPHI|nr:hypothetical protein [Pedobacter psychrotolerans]TCO20761.1 hypothetical protein EV200_108202 [Pedobacter psychrotolerans]GGE67876.1 hypothetical protein GCM10011413_38190 [Pedobacter psychrotolerans]
MEFNFYPEVYSYNLTLNLEVLREYHVDAQLMYDWGSKSNDTDLKFYPYLVTFYLNDLMDIDKQVTLLIDNVKLSTPIDQSKKIEFLNSLMYLCFELEKELLSTAFNDEDFLQLIKIGKKIQRIQEKELSQFSINRIMLDDEKIAKSVRDIACKLLLHKFKACAKHTRYNKISSINEVINFVNGFKVSNESIHLSILGHWADLIQAYLHNGRYLISIDKTKLNTKNKKQFPLTVQQSDFIYSLFELFNFLTPRNRETFSTNAYIRNCISKFEESLIAESTDDLK